MITPLPPEDGLPPGLLLVVDTVGADIFARLVAERVKRTSGSVEESGLRWMADIALSAASVWGLRRHQTCEPCDDRSPTP